MLEKVNQIPFNEKKINLILDDSFKELMTFLITRQEEVTTLKDIKKQFSSIEHFSHYIDELIEFDIVKRYHGRYYFSGVFVPEESQKDLVSLVSSYLEKHQEKISEVMSSLLDDNQSTLSLFATLFSISDDDSVAIYEETSFSKGWLNLPTRLTQVAGKKMKLISMTTFTQLYGNNILDYFNFLTLKQQNLPNSYQELNDILGDINPLYFIHYCERKLIRLEKGKVISADKADIFMQALYFMGYVTIQDGSYQLTTEHFEQPKTTDELEILLRELEELVTPIETSDSQKKYMLRCVLIEWLISKEIVSLPITFHGMIKR